MATLSLVLPIGYSKSFCGYHSEPGVWSEEKSFLSYGLWAIDLAPEHYQLLVDRGWRRSGQYVYKPDMRRTCCPHYTIRLEADAFHPSKSQRKTLSRFNSFLRQPTGCEEGVGVAPDAGKLPKASKKKGKDNAPFDLARAVEEGENMWKMGGKKLEVDLHPASATKEKYALFRAYQAGVHKEAEDKISNSQRWMEFLVDSPMRIKMREAASSSTSTSSSFSTDETQALPYGTYHQTYRLDGELIAVAVLDILPKCVSSVYLYYHPKWEKLSLGKVAALRELDLVQRLRKRKGMEDLQYYYMGYYIHTCPKMRYKADYAPSELLDPEAYTWHAYEEVKPLLDAHQYACFSEPCRSSAERPLHWPPSGDERADSSNEKTAPTLTADAQATYSDDQRVRGWDFGLDSNSEDGESDREEEEEGEGREGEGSSSRAKSGKRKEGATKQKKRKKGKPEYVPIPADPPPAGMLNPLDLPEGTLFECLAMERDSEVGVLPAVFLPSMRNPTIRRKVADCAAALGDEVVGKCVMYIVGQV